MKKKFTLALTTSSSNAIRQTLCKHSLRSLLTLLALAALTAFAENGDSVSVRLMPKPKVIQFVQSPESRVQSDVAVTVNMVSDAELGLFNHNVPGFPNEGYKLDISAGGITITCASATGEIRARQTLAQLLTDGHYPTVYIEDYPSFKVRGYMHDVGRSFISVEELKREIDLLARFKVNVFYWHLTDHHAFRFESKLYPQVNTHFTSSRWPNKYYTQEECREICQYAAERGMIVIPEIDMPGHSTSFTNAMGYKMSSAQGKTALKAILGEVAEVFAESPYIHIGGDETSEATRAFVNEMGDCVRGLGKKVVCWNRYSESPRTLVDTGMSVDMVTNWASNGTLINGMPNIDMRYNYVNHFDVFADIAGIYRSTVFGVEQGTNNVAGAITGIWNDRLVDSEEQIVAQNNLYAVTLATNERAWCGGGKQYIEQGGAYLPNDGEEFDDFADWEERFLHYKDKWMKDEPIPYVKQTNVRWNISQPFSNGGDGSKSFTEIEGVNDLTTIKNATTVTGAGIWLNHIWGTVIRGALGTGVGSPTNQTRYAWTYVHSETEQTVGAQIEFYNYSRSDNGKVQQNGKWDLMGSRVWLNDTELIPTWKWTNAGQSVGNTETPLGNVNFPARQPLQVNLKAGWNKVLIKLPWVNAGQQRPSKWQYTFVFTTTDGKKEIDGLVYSPMKILNHDEEVVREQIDNARNQVSERCKDKLGYYEPSIATTVNSALDDAEKALTEEPVNYAEISARVSAAYEEFLTLLTDDNLVKPSVDSLYTLSTPLRAGYFVNSSGVGSQMVSTASLTDTGVWKFVSRGDGTWNIRNNKDNSYITPNTTDNAAISAKAAVPSSGWTLRAGATPGYLIITSGTKVELNQTGSAQSYKLYNWGVNTVSGQTFNTTDTGCQFSINVYHAPEPEPTGVKPVAGKRYTMTNVQQSCTFPLYVDGDELKVGTKNKSVKDYGDDAVWLCEEKTAGKLSFRNEKNDCYLVWRNLSNDGYNNHKGTAPGYVSPFCDWALKQSSNVDDCFYIVSKRGNGTTDGSLILLASGVFDGYSGTEGYSATFSNLWRFFDETPTGVSHVENVGNVGNCYDLAGRKVDGDYKGIVIVNEKKILRK